MSTVSGDEISLDEQSRELREDLARSDAKASLLLAGEGALLAVLAAAQPSGPGQWAVVVGMVLMGVSAVLLLIAVRPRIGGPMLAGTPGWWPETHLGRRDALARVARRKFRLLRAAVDLLVAGGAVVATGLGVEVIV
ncbi:hypothetical protein RIF23_14730 [Lipingzhangella sp. LS1_29]|uniref:Pycsar effector protein domain-containing protein n=1 Tax=Lipingzhangella rawalii TaxID=2055835 RepID=A0ABU2H8B6_9ACTN|nr:hypothetical protein [Lipingzhangella rawalii]MDS1271552.1 hypothetical protein [Lipingzhangella rawalii]